MYVRFSFPQEERRHAEVIVKVLNRNAQKTIGCAEKAIRVRYEQALHESGMALG